MSSSAACTAVSAIDVDVERQRDVAHRLQRRRLADHDADAHAGQAVRLRERSPDEHVRVAAPAAGRKLSPPNSM